MMKLGWLRDYRGAQQVTFATGTPMANSMREMFVMQRFLRNDDLVAAGVEHFDGWAAQFCTSKTALELAPAGGSHRIRTRIAGFTNAPELVGHVPAVRGRDAHRRPRPANPRSRWGRALDADPGTVRAGDRVHRRPGRTGEGRRGPSRALLRKTTC